MLSVYLSSTEKRTPYYDYLLSQFHSLIHQNLSEEERKKWKKDIEKIEDFLHESYKKSNSRSYIFFSSGKNFWKVYDFEFSLPPQCIISDKPYLDPLKNALGKHQKYLSLLVDREKARLFIVHLGKIEEQREIFAGSVPQNVKAKKIDWGRENKIFRHIQDHLHRYLQFIAKAVMEFSRKSGIRFVVIGGHAEMIPKMKKHLLYPLNKMVLGEFVTELNVPLSNVLRLSKKAASQINP